MSGDLVLITGSTGHIGFQVLLAALERGYSVRATVRSEAKAKHLLSAPQLQGVSGERLSTVIVPDLVVPGAHDEALKGGVKYVIHIASPLADQTLTKEQYDDEMFKPAVKGTLGILESAKKTGTVSRVVITSSIAALQTLVGMTAPSDMVYTADTRVPSQNPEDLENFLQAYFAAKAKAFNESEAWMKRESPQFDLVNLHPSYVLGPELLHPTIEGLTTHGTNGLVLGMALGVKFEVPFGNVSVHVEDVARVHVDSLDPKIPGNASYILNSDVNPELKETNFSAVPEYVARLFPDAVAKGLLPNNGEMASVEVKMDARKTEETFGFTHKNFEQQVKDVVEQYLALVQKS